MHKDLFTDYIFNILLVIGSDWTSSWGNACKHFRWFHIEKNLNIYIVCIVLKKNMLLVNTQSTAESWTLMVGWNLHINHVDLRLELILYGFNKLLISLPLLESSALWLHKLINFSFPIIT